jgi:tricorn protease
MSRHRTVRGTSPVRALVVISFLALAALIPSAAAVSGQDLSDVRMASDPAVSAHHIAFQYDGDLWVANRDGSAARRLTTHAGIESSPRFSPDGRWLAFTGEYDGNVDVFVVPVAGGAPTRLTWHPGPDVVLDWTPDSRAVLFRSPRAVHTNRHTQLFTVSIDGGQPEAIPVPHAAKAAFSPDGRRIAYTPLSDATDQWKHYRGGRTARIWLYDRGDHAVVEVPQPEGRSNDTDPVWLGDRVYFRSDRNGEFNIFAYDIATGRIDQLTSHQDFPVVAVSGGAGALIYEQAGWLHLLDTAAGESHRLRIALTTDLADTRPRFASGPQYLRNYHLSPSGARAVFEYRGNIVTVPAEHGDIRWLTTSSDAHERSPAWSPDGRAIAWFSDASGEYELVVAPQDGRGEALRYRLDGAGFYEDPRWSPDGSRISFTDNSWSLYILELANGRVRKVASEPVYGPNKTLHHAWSPDSRWLAYTLNTRTYHQQVHLHEVATGRSTVITEGLADVAEPVFDASGKYLWFLASTDAGPVREWFAQSNQDMRMSGSLYLAVLARGEESPLKGRSDEERPRDPAAANAGAAGGGSGSDASAGGSARATTGSGAAGAPPPTVTVDFDGLAERIVAVPAGTGRFRALQPGSAGQLYYLRAEDDGGWGLRRFDLEEREEETLLPDAVAYTLSDDRKKLLARVGPNWLIADAGKVDPAKGRIATGDIRPRVDPRAEWRQMLREAWRINRDYFYDPGMHGAEWAAVWARYEPFLDHLTNRDDLARLIRWMLSELAVGHSYSGGGDYGARPDRVPGGLLGAEYDVADGRYRFARVFGGLNWTPELRSPLTEPGVDVRAGEYLLAVDGVEIRPPENLFRRFENTAGRQVQITIGPRPDGRGARTVTVVPVESEMALRNRDWVEGNIRKVHAATGGRVAYVYVPNTAALGHEYFKRYFFPQAHLDAIIVDERYNGGGQVADYYIDLLRRPYSAHWATRYGDDIRTPIAAIHGPKVMIIDETAGSGGDLLPWMFREYGLGKLIGRRTWGGLVGILGFPVLMDGGSVTAPNLAFWTEEEGFGIENVGVPPDIEVEQWPADVIAGRDPQLERAIQQLLTELDQNPPAQPVRPPFPVRVRR